MDSRAFEQDSDLSPVQPDSAASTGEESLDELEAFFQRLKTVDEEPWPERFPSPVRVRADRASEARSAAQRVV
ncbi:MAG TPA: hypothetical protein VL359_03840, partial [bacterium]|nr:hypothetical protein [bacterium]